MINNLIAFKAERGNLFMKIFKMYKIYEINDYGKKRIAVCLTPETAVEYVKANLTYDSDSESAVDRVNNNKWVSTEKA